MKNHRAKWLVVAVIVCIAGAFYISRVISERSSYQNADASRPSEQRATDSPSRQIPESVETVSSEDAPVVEEEGSLDEVIEEILDENDRSSLPDSGR